MAEWRTPRRNDACSGTDRPFEEGERIYSVLCATEDGLSRKDFSTAWFEENQASVGAVYWWATVHRTEKKRGLAIDFDTIEQVFLSLEGRKETRVRELRYLMCLLLLRKRRLKMVRVKRAGDEEAMVVRRPRREEELEVQVFDLTAERAGELSVELQSLFDAGDPEELSVDLEDREAGPPGEREEPSETPDGAPDGTRAEDATCAEDGEPAGDGESAEERAPVDADAARADAAS